MANNALLMVYEPPADFTSWVSGSTSIEAVAADGWTTESQAIFDFPAGTLSNLWVRVTTAGTTSSTFAMRINSSSTGVNESVAITTSTGIFTDSTHTDVITAGNAIDYSFTNPASIVISIWAVTFAASSNTTTVAGTSYRVSSFFTSGTDFATPIGLTASGGGYTSAEAGTKNRQQQGMNITNLGIQTVSTGSGTGTITGRINGATANLTISVATNTTGLSQDTTHTDSPTAGQDYDFTFTYNSNFHLADASAWYTNSSGYSILSCANDKGLSIAKSVTDYFGLSGILDTNTTESAAQVTANSVYTFSDITTLITANTVSATSSVTLRANTASPSSGPSASITASTAAVFADTTHTYVCASTDLLDYQLVTGGTGTSLTVNFVSIWAQTSAAPSIPTFVDTFYPKTMVVEQWL